MRRPAIPRDLGLLAVATIAVCGALVVLGYGREHWGLSPAFDLDAEWVVPAVWSSGLLLAAAGAAARVRIWGLAALFLFMGIDELVGIHESLERATGVDWELLYLPVVAFGGVAWLRTLRRAWTDERAAAVLLVAGAGAWFVAQVFEKLEWTSRGDISHYAHTAHYYPLMYAEEGLEMLGSSAFLFALLLLARSWGAARAERREGVAAV